MATVSTHRMWFYFYRDTYCHLWQDWDQRIIDSVKDNIPCRRVSEPLKGFWPVLFINGEREADLVPRTVGLTKESIGNILVNEIGGSLRNNWKYFSKLETFASWVCKAANPGYSIIKKEQILEWFLQIQDTE